MPVQTQLQIRRDTAANWTSTNPTLASGEWGLETDTRQYKIGDGVTAWNSLGYQLGPLLDEEIATDPTGAYFTGSGFQLNGVGSNYATAPDAAALDITGDLDLRVKLSMVDWGTSGADQFIMMKYTNAAGNRSYGIWVRSNTIRLGWTADGSTGNLAVSTANIPFSNNSTGWIRATLDVNNGASGRDITFYTSTDGTNWTQLGNVVTQAGTTSIFSGNAELVFGQFAVGNNSNPLNGTIYRAQVLNGINGTTAFDANFETVPADSFAFTESSANAATVTLTTTRYSFGIPNGGFTSTFTQTWAQNVTNYLPFVIRNKPITIKHIAFETASAPASAISARIGIYAAGANLQPTGNIIYSSDAISISTAAAAIYRIRVTPFTLLPGNYLLAFNNSGSALTNFRTFNTFGPNFAPNTLGANLSRSYQISATLSGAALPTTGTLWNTRNPANGPIPFPIILGWS